MSSLSAIAEQAPDATAPTVTTEQLDLIRRTVANGATADELKLYLFDCARQGVHPLDRLIHFTKRKGKYTPITSIDFMRIRAADSGEMAGSDEPVFAPRHPPEVSQHPDEATVTVYRMTQGQRFAYTATARWAEYYPGDGDGSFMWRKMPHTMLGKCAEALALRKGFPRQLAGLYAKEEMDQAGYVVEAPSGSVVLSGPMQSAGNTSAPNVGDSGTSDNGPDLGADLPVGARLVVNVGPGRVGAQAEITFSAPLDAGKSTFLTYKELVAIDARKFWKLAKPCIPEIKKSQSGNYRVENIFDLPAGYQ